jgi:tagatose-1,6-bisphosphate aldolase non-catalytic subunit AgaZ/GatZ
VIQHRLRQYFRLDASVRGSATVAFELIAPIPREAVERATDLATIPDDEVDVSFRHSLDLVGPDDGVNVAAAHVMQYVHLERKEKALETLETYRSLTASDNSEFPQVMNYLDQMA